MTEFFKHPNAVVESTDIGANTRIWAFVHVLPGAKLGSECNICDHVFIENKVLLGDRVTIKSGVQLWDGVELEDDVFVGPNVTFTNDRFPRSKRHLDEYPRTLVKQGASLGANSTILPGITIGQYAMVGAGAVVTRNVPPYSVVAGNPARIIRYVDDATPFEASATATPRQPGLSEKLERQTAEPKVNGVALLNTRLIRDLRGNLSAREVDSGLPFAPKRTFLIFGVPTKEVRGEHAHRQCEQLLVCVQGSVRVLCDDGTNRQEYTLNSIEQGLYLPPMVWGVQYHYSEDAILLVYASHAYDAADYIRDYDTFLIEKKTETETTGK
jgi:UDP-2-acetamido-3-amino-2,3-dideoxy-glucuronate N-acetyltransferase